MRRLTVADLVLCALALASAGWVLFSFWPGSIAFDFPGTLEEAAIHWYDGHQPPSAAVATWVLTAGTVEPAVLFLVKVIACFGTLIVLVVRAHPPMPIRVAATALLLSPAFLYLAPMLRSNVMEITLLGVAVAVGVGARSRWSMAVTAVAFLLAVMFANAPHPGHVALVVLFFLWHFPAWSVGRYARACSLALLAMAAPLLLVYLVTGRVDRSPTLYVSALNGIGGLVRSGMTPCLDQGVVRGTDASPSQVYSDHFTYPDIAPAIWDGTVGFKDPGALSTEERRSVISCWQRMVADKPWTFARERLALAAITMRASNLEPHFVFLAEADSLRFNPDFEKGVDLRAGAQWLLDYGRFAVRHGLASFPPYAIMVLSTSTLLLLFGRGYRLFALFSVASVIGFCLPQWLAAQAVNYRYYVVPSYVASWLAILHAWILLGRTPWWKGEPGSGTGLVARGS